MAADEGGSSSESTRPGAAQWLPLDVDKKQGRDKKQGAEWRTNVRDGNKCGIEITPEAGYDLWNEIINAKQRRRVD